MALVLVILDGWGFSETKEFNAIATARTPTWDKLTANNPHSLINASEESVGLPTGQMGNSEVGHMHIGAGRRVPQNYSLINTAIASKDFYNNITLIATIAKLKQTNKALHVMGLFSAGGVHSHSSHLYATLKLCQEQNFRNVWLHLFLDGRDTPPQSALEDIKFLEEFLRTHPGKIATISGRYYAMDRDKNWERTAEVYKVLTCTAASTQAPNATAIIKKAYQNNIFDEFIPATKIQGAKSISSGDSIFYFNFRADRARQLTQTFVDKSCILFQSSLKLNSFITMTPYATKLSTKVVFPNKNLNNTLGEIVAKNNLRQLRIAETEKYPHVTFFFNGGREEAFKNETRKLIPSPKVATFDLQPEMNAAQLTTALVDAITSQQYDFIVCNYANADMVGHTGNFKATLQAITYLDHCLAKISSAITKTKTQMIITADHGNAEKMFDNKTQQNHTSHTCSLVPFLYLGDAKLEALDGNLTDLAPTILTLMNLPVPPEMTGQNLLRKK